MSTIFRPRSDGWQGLLSLIKSNDEFRTSTDSFRGTHWNADSAKLPNRGQMPEHAYNTLERLHRTRGINYVVWSYQTPIAYRTTDGCWHIPNVRYSNTTSRQQGLVMTVAGVLGDQAA